MPQVLVQHVNVLDEVERSTGWRTRSRLAIGGAGDRAARAAGGLRVAAATGPPLRLGAGRPRAEGFSLAHLRYLVIDEADRVIEMTETG
ncbi:hypothetical protein FJT64_027645 [Amphibalanus amphitrite]|uniref:Uncharacterized protein n=1 Tax=Amphibalanus amphitrite TaxID=1232801 RepID=A0A6A4W321_AMPAM|nr:hypothetical protein FJT64_027645 [Amphibalanus amphitrite]